MRRPACGSATFIDITATSTALLSTSSGISAMSVVCQSTLRPGNCRFNSTITGATIDIANDGLQDTRSRLVGPSDSALANSSTRNAA
jgi:hypothetical protein